jgi:hypothetical protein
MLHSSISALPTASEPCWLQVTMFPRSFQSVLLLICACGILGSSGSVHLCVRDKMADWKHFAGIIENKKNIHSTRCTAVLIFQCGSITSFCWTAELEVVLCCV